MEMDETAKDKDVLETIASAYALVVCADARLSASEKVRFDRILQTHSAFREMSVDVLKFYFTQTAEALKTDYKAGKERILARLAKLDGSDENRKAIFLLVRAAVVADSQIKPQENTILQEIEQAMGLDAGTL